MQDFSNLRDIQTGNGSYIDIFQKRGSTQSFGSGSKSKQPERFCVIPNKLYWEPLGFYTKCQVPSCSQIAYNFCEWELRTCFGLLVYFKGCGRRVCTYHTRIYLRDKVSCGKEKEQYLASFHCSDSKCESEFKSKQYLLRSF
mmetsp:Transcript_4649/g.7885  ORF Transcript_4649/g.7885 Transcript_4649/m.7885 type:complete len:142 (+) Transcript_4649:116-541(+)